MKAATTTSRIEARLAQLGHALPPPPRAMATYQSAVLAGTLLHIAGQGPMVEGRPTVRGKVGADVTPADAYDAARIACLNALAVAKESLGNLDRVKRAVRATVWVACANDFYEQPRVANGATDLLRDLWGEAALPTRCAVGANALPMNIPVELELVLEVESR